MIPPALKLLNAKHLNYRRTHLPGRRIGLGIRGRGFASPRPKRPYRGPSPSREPGFPCANPPSAAGPRCRGFVKIRRPRVRQIRLAPKTRSSRVNCVREGRLTVECSLPTVPLRDASWLKFGWWIPLQSREVLKGWSTRSLPSGAASQRTSHTIRRATSLPRKRYASLSVPWSRTS